METIGGQGNLWLTCRKCGGGVEITRVETADRVVTLPQQLWGLPVLALGDHAFSPGRRTAAGEQIRVVCGAEAAFEPCNDKIESVTLPDTLETVGDYAFYNCFSLKKLCLTDKAAHWGAGVLMNCRLLDTFHITLSGDRAEVLRYFADELIRELDVTLVYPDGETARLLFPEYIEDYEENTPAKHFDYHIYGAGYPYHHCFRQKALQLREYDRLWLHLLGMEYSADCALRLAYYRLRYPRELSGEAKQNYLGYVGRHAEDALAWLLRVRDIRGISWLLSTVQPDVGVLEAACEQARLLGLSEAVAVLLEEQHRRTSVRREKTFAL